jgi:hypothetical protein
VCAEARKTNNPDYVAKKSKTGKNNLFFPVMFRQLKQIVKEVLIMNDISNVSYDASMEEMFRRMGDLLKNISASRNGLSDEIREINEFRQPYEPGVGERVDLTA